jgi:transcriptional regulator with XRE-family HTH domain
MYTYPNLKLQIFKTGIHQNRLAKLLGIGETALSKIIHGYREPSDDERKKLSDYLAADPDWLFQKYEQPSEMAPTELSIAKGEQS